MRVMMSDVEMPSVLWVGTNIPGANKHDSVGQSIMHLKELLTHRYIHPNDEDKGLSGYGGFPHLPL